MGSDGLLPHKMRCAAQNVMRRALQKEMRMPIPFGGAHTHLILVCSGASLFGLFQSASKIANIPAIIQ